jgi:hypothetical protein
MAIGRHQLNNLAFDESQRNYGIARHWKRTIGAW